MVCTCDEASNSVRTGSYQQFLPIRVSVKYLAFEIWLKTLWEFESPFLFWQVRVWEATTGQVRQSLTCNQPVLDVCSVVTNDGYYLCSLTEKQLMLYTWT